MFCMSASTVFLTLNCNFTPLRTNGISSSILLLLSFIFIQQKSEGAKAPPAPPPARSLDDAVLHHSGSICDQTLGLTLRTFQKCRKKRGAAAPLAPPLNPPMLKFRRIISKAERLSEKGAVGREGKL